MAVYTQPGDAELAALLADYDIGELFGLHGIQEGVENSNFRLDTIQGRFILTIYEKRVDPADLPFFLGLMEHLARAGLPCPLPIHDREGGALRNLRGKPAAIVTFLEGRWPRRITVGRCEALGEALAELHLAGRDFHLRRQNALDLAGWRQLFEGCRGTGGRGCTRAGGEIGPSSRRSRQPGRHDLPRGVIHADLFPDNVFFEGDQVTGVIDFYFACQDLLAYDLAICLNAWCFEQDYAFNVTKARALSRAIAAGARRARSRPCRCWPGARHCASL